MPANPLELIAQLREAIAKGNQSQAIAEIFKQTADLTPPDLDIFHQNLLSCAKEFTKIDEKGNNLALHVAAFGRAETAKFLIGKNYGIYVLNNAYENFLIIATKHANNATLRVICDKIITQSFGINASDSEGRTALFHALRMQNIEATKILLDINCNPSSRDHMGNNCFNFAVASGDYELFTLLLKHPASSELTDEYYAPALLHDCASGGSVAITKKLISRGLRIDCIGKRVNHNLLQLACLKGKIELADFASQTIDPHSKNNCDIDSFDYLAFAEYSQSDGDKKLQLQQLFERLSKKKNPNISAEEIENLKKLSVAKIMLKFLYLDESMGWPSKDEEIYYRAFAKLDEDSDLSDDLKGRFSAVINRYLLDRKPQDALYAMHLENVSSHAAYFVIDWENDDLYYVDGNGIFSDKFTKPKLVDGVARFKIDKTKFYNRQELASHLNEVCRYGSVEAKCDQYFLEAVADECKSADRFKPVETLIPCDRQERNNCPWKSLGLLFRLMNYKLHGAESKVENGAIVGDNHEMFKKIKYAFVRHCIKSLQEVSAAGVVGADEILSAAKSKAEKKLSESDKSEDAQDLAHWILDPTYERPQKESEAETPALVSSTAASADKFEPVSAEQVTEKSKVKNPSCCAIS